MGRVYLAHDKKHDRHVAIKVLAPDYAHAVGTQRFIREIHIAATLSHPSIVPLYDSGEFDGQLFYVMPHIEGESLRQRLERETMLPVAQAIEWAAQVADGLAVAHARGIVHRDIKPENLLLQGDRILIADFGIARAIDLAVDEGITTQALAVGTPKYMSPEQAAGAAHLDGRSDLYSLACVVYEMLGGDPPYTGHTPQAITARKLAGEYRRLRVVRPVLSPALDQTLAKALNPVPADRFTSVEEFSRSLRAAGKPGGWRRPIVLAALGLAVLPVGLAVMHFWPHTAPPAHRPRIVVGMFENRTGDARHDPLSFMAADWLTEGLQETGQVDVVPSSTALAATRFLQKQSGASDPVRSLARETGADLVVSGSIYREQDSLVFQAQLASAAAGHLVGAVEPLRASEGRPGEALQQLRARLMGLLALSLDDRAIQTEKPPTYVAYQAFSQGMDAYVRGDYAPALLTFERAYQADTTFGLALLYASFCYMNRREYALADSVLRIVATRREGLNEYNRSWLDYQQADLSGDTRAALNAIHHAAVMAPSSKAPYNFASAAFEARLPFAAESTLRQLSPDVGAMRGWLPYWEILATSLHVQGKHRAELSTARQARQRFPDRLGALRLEALGLAAQKQVTGLERLWSKVGGTNSLEAGALAYEVAEELWAHADSSTAVPWYRRAYGSFSRAAGAEGGIEARWGLARTTARLGRWKEASDLAEALAIDDPNQKEQYMGLMGVAAARQGQRSRALELMKQLAGDNRPFTFGEPLFQAGRIATVLGELDQAQAFLASALRQGNPYDIDFHRDRSLAPLRGLPIMTQLDIRQR
jgi:serine/threonine-protein kinase